MGKIVRESYKQTCFEVDGMVPVVAEGCFIHPSAEVIGDVVLGKKVYVGPGARLRGDMGRIVVGDGANVQDNCVLHGWPLTDTVIEKDGHLGHGAVVHGASIGEGALIGINTVVLDGAVVGSYAIVGAQALVPGGFKVPPRTMAFGIPVKVRRQLSAEEVSYKTTITGWYHMLSERCRNSLRPVKALKRVQQNRPRIQDIRPELDLKSIHKA